MQKKLFEICKSVKNLEVTKEVLSIFKDSDGHTGQIYGKRNYFDNLVSGGYFHTLLLWSSEVENQDNDDTIQLPVLSESELSILRRGDKLIDEIFEILFSPTTDLPKNIKDGLNPKLIFKPHTINRETIELDPHFRNEILQMGHLFKNSPLIIETIKLYQQFKKDDKSRIKSITPKGFAISLQGIEKEVNKMDEPNSLLYRIRGENIKKLSNEEHTTLFMFYLYTIRATIIIYLDTIFSSMLDHPLIVISKDNLIDIKHETSDALSVKRDYVLELNPVLMLSLHNFSSLVLMTYKRGAKNIYDFGRLLNTTITMASEHGELATCTVVVLDKYFSPYSWESY